MLKDLTAQKYYLPKGIVQYIALSSMEKVFIAIDFNIKRYQ